MATFSEFKSNFNFNRNYAFRVGVERECFIIDASHRIVPKAQMVLDHIHNNDEMICDKNTRVPSFGYELSACQIETRTQPTTLVRLEEDLESLDTQLNRTLKKLGLLAWHQEVAPDTMPLDVYPDPTGRYAEITTSMPKKVLLAACQVIGTHVHIGMPDHETALRVYNSVIDHCNELCTMGDHSSGKRMEIYQIVAPNYKPQPYENWFQLYEAAKENSFVHDLRSCWTIIRLTVHGTIEFRMFGTTNSIPKIVQWATYCHRLCTESV